MHDEIRNLYIKKLFQKYNIQSLPNLKKALIPLCKSDKYNIFLFMHLGDDFQRLGQLKEFEKEYGKIHLIIQPNEIFFMDMFKFADYTIFDLNKWLKKNVPVSCKNKYGEKEYFYHQLIENTISHYPQKEEPFIVFYNDKTWPEYEKQFGCIENMTSYAKASLGIYNNTRMDVKNINYPNLSTELENKLEKIALLDKIVLFLPEARTDELLNKKIWNELSVRIRKLGFVIIENVTDKRNSVQDALDIDFSLSDLIALGKKCHAIFSLRSGLCDILSSRGKDLFVLWPKSRFESSESFFRFSSCYELDENDLPQNFVLSKDCITDIPFENENIARGLKNSWLPETHKELNDFIKLLIIIKNNGIKDAIKKVMQKISRS